MADPGYAGPRVGESVSDFPNLTEREQAEPEAAPVFTGDGTIGVDNLPAVLPRGMEWLREYTEGLSPRLPAYDPQTVFKAIMGIAPLPDDPDASTFDGIAMRILTAPSMADVLSEPTAQGTEVILGLPVMLDKPRWYRSDYEQNALCFCVVEAITIDDGIVHTVTIGAQQPMLVIMRAMATGELPLKCKVVRSGKATRAGFLPLNIVAA